MLIKIKNARKLCCSEEYTNQSFPKNNLYFVQILYPFGRVSDPLKPVRIMFGS